VRLDNMVTKEELEKLKKAEENAYWKTIEAHEALAFAEEELYYAQKEYLDALKERYNGHKRKRFRRREFDEEDIPIEQRASYKWVQRSIETDPSC